MVQGEKPQNEVLAVNYTENTTNDCTSRRVRFKGIRLWPILALNY